MIATRALAGSGDEGETVMNRDGGDEDICDADLSTGLFHVAVNTVCELGADRVEGEQHLALFDHFEKLSDRGLATLPAQSLDDLHNRDRRERVAFMLIEV